MQLDATRFIKLWQSQGGDRGAQMFAEIARYYAEDSRFYHTAQHIVECLHKMDSVAKQSPKDKAVELAIWFHDVIYVIGAPDNEAQSALWFASQARGQLPDELIKRVSEYIHATTHQQPPSDPGAQLVVDIDLSGLGNPTDKFHHDGANIRREMSHLSDAEFCKCQSGFLQSLLKREYIYCTELFRQRYERRARENINNALARYAKGEY